MHLKRAQLRWFRAICAGALVVLLAGTVAIGQHYLLSPPVKAGRASTDTISLHTAEGQRLLAESDARVDYPGLAAHFVGQSRRSFCGPATAVTTLNALRPEQAPLDQRTFFSAPHFNRLAPFKLSFTGMSLRQFAESLRAHNAEVAMVYASDVEMAEFRSVAQRNLQSRGDFLLVNYQRAVLGQEPSGHISPIAAYHAGTDRLLILDVAAHKYPPVWVSVEALWKAMHQPLNPETSRTRGYVVVGMRSHAKAAPAQKPSSVLSNEPKVR